MEAIAIRKMQKYSRQSLHLIFFLLGFTISAQKAPWWYNNPPESSSDKFCYINVLVGAGQDVLDLAIPKAISCIGVSYKAYSEQSNGVVKIQTESGDRVIRYQRVDSKPGPYGGEYVLMMFTKQEMKEKKKLPRARRHLPLSFLFSAAIPGTGQFYKKQHGKGWAFFLSTAMLAGGAYYFETERSQAYDDFYASDTFNEREDLQQQVEANQNIRNALIAGAGITYVINVLDALASKGRRYAHKPSSKVQWNLAAVPTKNGVIASANVAIRIN